MTRSGRLIAAMLAATALLLGAMVRTANAAARADAGNPIAAAAGTITATPESTPWGTENTDHARALLTDGLTSYGSNNAVLFDFFSQTGSGGYVDVTAEYDGAATMQSITLNEFNMNSEFAVDAAEITTTAPDNSTTTVIPTIDTAPSGLVTVTYDEPTPTLIKAVTVRVHTPYKLNLTELSISGTAYGVMGVAVDDPAPRHVHQPGTPFTVGVTPLPVIGDELAPNFQSMTLTPGATPFGTDHTDQAPTLLTDGKTNYAPDQGVYYDFYGVDPDKKYVDITVGFAGTATVQSVTLDEFNMNGNYGVTSANVTLRTPDGGTITGGMALSTNPSGLTTATYTSSPAQATAITVRVSTDYKLNLTELAVTGKPPGSAMTMPGTTMSAQWVDYAGAPIGSPVPIYMGQRNEVPSPPDPPAGYYGLVFSTSTSYVFTGHIPGETRTYGFAVDPVKSLSDRQSEPTSPFGTVNTDTTDPQLLGWSKTLEWSTADPFDPATWQDAVAAATGSGLTELPLVVGGDWDSSDSEPITQTALDRLTARMQAHFQATPNVEAWELGLEENLHHDISNPTYLANLQAKAAAVRQAARQAGVTVTLAYQLVVPPQYSGAWGDVTTFLSSPAAAEFDVLALHPYAWPDFPTPDGWMQDFMSFIQQQIAQYRPSMQVWFSEIGAPVQDLYAGGTYRDNGNPAQGLSPHDDAVFLAKTYLLGLDSGVQRILWYNYRDRGTNRAEAEDNFGMVDYWGYPKPTYLAYLAAQHNVDGRAPAGITQLADGVTVAKYSGGLYAIWTPSGNAVTVPWSDLGLTRSDISTVTNTVDQPLDIPDSGAPAGPDPIYISTNQ